MTPAARPRPAGWVENAAPVGRWPRLRLAEPWAHRELIYFFALRDLKVRYKQAFLGAGWAAVQPLAGAVAFTVLFNTLARVELGSGSYFTFALIGFVVFTYVSSAVGDGAASLLSNSELLTKVAFPKVAAPLASLLLGLVDLTVGVVLAIVVSLLWGDGLSPVGFVVGLPLGTALLLLTAAGPALFFSACVVKYRDALALVTFGLQLLLFVSPVAYPPELVPERWRTVQYLNPLAGCLALFRWALAGADLPSPGYLVLSAASAIVVLAGGLLYFRANERQFADII